MIDLSEKVIYITGASRGIGRACALRFIEAGANVIVHARDKTHLNLLLSATDAVSDRVISVSYDVVDADAMRSAFQLILTRFGKLDAFVNNAGIMENAVLGMITREQLEKTLAVNLEAAILHMQFASRLMQRNKSGSIVNLGSIVGERGAPGQVAYAASKAGLVGATRAAAKELAPQGIRVNALVPGFINTDMNAGHSSEKRASIVANIGMGRMGTPDEVADAALFLVSDLSKYITGQTLGVDGGMVL